jgi:hypothetical protein
MTRMTREFSLVLLGAGMLTAAYMLWPEPDPDTKANEQAEKRVGGHSGRVHAFIWIHSAGGARTSYASSLSSGNVARSGIGSTAARVGGGST